MDTQNERLVLKSVVIHPWSLVMFSKIEWSNYTPYKRNNSLNNLKSHFNKNRLSEQAKRKMTKAIKYLIYSASEKTAYNNKAKCTFKFKVNMVTLTLSSMQAHSDKKIKSVLLNHMLVELRKKYKGLRYVWKAEKQNNGNIHFHIITDKFIPWNELQNTWNRIQNKLQYIDNNKYLSKAKQANSSDVHSLKKISNVAAYLTKYMLKSQYKNHVTCKRSATPLKSRSFVYRPFLSENTMKFLRSLADNGRIWGCSFDLSNLRGGQSELDDDILKEIEKLQKTVGSKRIDSDNYSIVLFNEKVFDTGNFPLLRSLLFDFLTNHFGYMQQDLIFNEYKLPVSP
jgi:hypothetical protein